jgi:hypothetical protein
MGTIKDRNALFHATQCNINALTLKRRQSEKKGGSNKVSFPFFCPGSAVENSAVTAGNPLIHSTTSSNETLSARSAPDEFCTGSLRRLEWTIGLRMCNASMTFSYSVTVGTALASGPPCRSVRAELLHTALTSDEGGKSLLGPGMENAGRGYPGIGDLRHAFPSESGSLAPTSEGFVP